MGIRNPLPRHLPWAWGEGPELLDWQQAEPQIKGPPSDFLSDSHGLLRRFSLLPLEWFSLERCIMEIGGDIFGCDNDWEG